MGKRKRGVRIPTRAIIAVLMILLEIGILVYFSWKLSEKSFWVYTVAEVVSIFTVIYIINRKGNPNYKIMWIIFILLVPYIGVLTFLLWGGGRVFPYIKRHFERIVASYQDVLAECPDLSAQLAYHDLLHVRQASYLSAASGFPAHANTSCEYLSPGEVFLPRLLEELKQAKRYILIEFFILAEGEMWEQVFSVLKRKAEAGVEIKIMFDDFGSINRQYRDFVKRVRAAGMTISIFNPFRPSLDIFMNNRNHHKIVVIDGKTAITGGINIGDEYINRTHPHGYWMDCAAIFKGDAVRNFVVMFCIMWEFTTRKHLDARHYLADAPVKAEGFVLPYSDDPIGTQNPGEGIYMQILNTAQRYVYIASPYLILDSNMINTLTLAANSGIDVRILTPSVPDKWYVHPVTQHNYTELLEAGVRIFEYTPGFIHSKLFVSDDKVATIGTVNMDYRSFFFHFECGAWICGNDTVLDIRNHLLSLIEHSEEIHLESWKKRPFLLKCKQAILHIFAPFM